MVNVVNVAMSKLLVKEVSQVVTRDTEAQKRAHKGHTSAVPVSRTLPRFLCGRSSQRLAGGPGTSDGKAWRFSIWSWLWLPGFQALYKLRQGGPRGEGSQRAESLSRSARQRNSAVRSARRAGCRTETKKLKNTKITAT